MRAGTSGESTPDAAAVTGRDRATVLTTLFLLVTAAAAWAQVLVLPMAMGDMAGMEMAMSPTFVDGVGYVAAWAVMMAAMMLPSAMVASRSVGPSAISFSRTALASSLRSSVSRPSARWIWA